MPTAAEQLAQLDTAHQQALQARGKVDVDERAARQALTLAEDEVVSLMAAGKSVTDAQKRLLRARADAAQEWALLRRAKDQAVRSTASARARYATEHYQELRDAHAQEAEAAAANVTGALEQLLTAYRTREQVAQRGARLWSLVAQPQRNLTADSKARLAADAAEAALLNGPETPPVLPLSHLPADADLEAVG